MLGQESYGAEEYLVVFDQAIQLSQKGEAEEAIKLYEKVIELNPNFAPAYNYLGMAYQSMGLDIVEVAWYFKAAIDIDPSFDHANINLGKAYYNMGHFDLAELYTLKALETNPNSWEAKISLGWIYLFGKSDPEKAIVYFKDVSDGISHPSAFFGLGMAYSMAGDAPRVLGCITTLREMDEDALATQLESIIREDRFQKKQGDRPALQETKDRADPLAGPAPSRGANVQTSFGSPSATKITVTGAIPVRLKGKLTD